jgi:hypothetical protein
MIRQGDILLVPASRPDVTPEDCKRVDRYVLAVGEATGHEHALVGTIELAPLQKRYVRGALNEVLFVHVLDGGIIHPDHDPVPRPIARGWYEVRRQRVFTPAKNVLVED